MRRMAAANPLKARALQWLAQREHSRHELGERLQRWVQAQRRVRASVRLAVDLAEPSAAPPADRQAAPFSERLASEPALLGSEDIEALLDALQAEGLLSDARFVEGRIHARAARFGHRRIQQELRQHGVQMSADWADTLRSTEFQRACDLWSRRFGMVAAPRSADEARQARFLVGRGFSGDTVRAVLKWAASGRPEPEAVSGSD